MQKFLPASPVGAYRSVYISELLARDRRPARVRQNVYKSHAAFCYARWMVVSWL